MTPAPSENREDPRTRNPRSAAFAKVFVFKRMRADCSDSLLPRWRRVRVEDQAAQLPVAPQMWTLPCDGVDAAHREGDSLSFAALG